MTVDLRAIVCCDLGPIISGDVGANHISDRSGLVMMQGRLTIDGLISPKRGSAVHVLVACPQHGTVTRFPKVLRVIRAMPKPQEGHTEIEVGCKLALLKDRKDKKVIYRPNPWKPMTGQGVVEFCLAKLGIEMAPNSHQLKFRYMKGYMKLDDGYMKAIGEMLHTEGCYGRLRADEKFEILPLNFHRGQKGPVLTVNDLVSIEPVSGGAEPPDKFVVTYKAMERPAGTPDSTGTTPAPGQEESTFTDLTPAENTAVADYWTYSKTYSTPTKTTISYTVAQVVNGKIVDVPKTTVYMATPWSESYTRYKPWIWFDEQGNEQKSEIVEQKVDIKYAPLHAVNANFVTSLLKFQLGVNPALEVQSVSTTYYEYVNGTSGPVQLRTRTVNEMTEMEFAANLVRDYVVGTTVAGVTSYSVGYNPSTVVRYITTETVDENETIEISSPEGVRTMTRSFTTRYISRGLSQEGQQEFAQATKKISSNSLWGGYIQQFLEVRYEGTDVQVQIGKPAISERPNEQDRAAEIIQRGPAAFNSITESIAGQRGLSVNPASTGNVSSANETSKEAKGDVHFSIGQPPNVVVRTANYDMPWTPDDIVHAGTAKDAALAFGQREASLEIAHAYGFNIVSSFDRIPSRELDPVYIRLGNLEVAFLTDSLSYAFDASGIVVSSDLMLLGVTGYYGTKPTTSWVQLAAPLENLPQASAPTVTANP